MLGFGVSKSRNASWRLHYADKDARDFVREVTAHIAGTGAFQPQAVVLVSDADDWRREPDGAMLGPSSQRKALRTFWDGWRATRYLNWIRQMYQDLVPMTSGFF